MAERDLDTELRDAASRWRSARQDMLAVAAERDALIIEATDAGMSRRQIAALVGLNVGAIQQILQRRGRI